VQLDKVAKIIHGLAVLWGSLVTSFAAFCLYSPRFANYVLLEDPLLQIILLGGGLSLMLAFIFAVKRRVAVVFSSVSVVFAVAFVSAGSWPDQLSADAQMLPISALGYLLITTLLALPFWFLQQPQKSPE